MALNKNTHILRVYIVEDEPLIAETIKMTLEQHGVKVIGMSESFENALTEIQTRQANLVLLDINLEGNKDGIDLAHELDLLGVPYMFLTSQTDPSTITRVKEVKPLGFIVKPFTESGLLSNIELAWHQISLEKEEYIIIRSDGERIKLNQASILFVRAFDNYCYVVTSQKEYLIPHTLKSTSEKLNRDIFKKSHRSYLVNTSKIKGVKSDAVLIEDQEVPMSGTFRSTIEKLL